MVLLRTDSIELAHKDPDPATKREIPLLFIADGEAEFLSLTPGSILKTIGTLEPGVQKHMCSRRLGLHCPQPSESSHQSKIGLKDLTVFWCCSAKEFFINPNVLIIRFYEITTVEDQLENRLISRYTLFRRS